MFNDQIKLIPSQQFQYLNRCSVILDNGAGVGVIN